MSKSITPVKNRIGYPAQHSAIQQSTVLILRYSYPWPDAPNQRGRRCGGAMGECSSLGAGFCVAVAPAPGKYEDSEEENLPKRYTYSQTKTGTLTWQTRPPVRQGAPWYHLVIV